MDSKLYVKAAEVDEKNDPSAEGILSVKIRRTGVPIGEIGAHEQLAQYFGRVSNKGTRSNGVLRGGIAATDSNINGR